MRKKWYLLILVLAVSAVLLAACNQKTAVQETANDLSGKIIIFHAGSLTVPVDKLTKAFQEKHPGVSFETESGGSRTIARKVSELGKQADIVMSADYSVIDSLLIPDFASWNVRFARNTMVIAYTDKSKYADEINSDNWYDILTRDGVVYGHSEPDADPCGYRTLMVWQLAEAHYKIDGLNQKLADHCPAKNVRPKAVELIAMLESGDMDYAFEYRSVAVQHGLKYVELPEQINLGSIEYADVYKTATVEISGSEPGKTVTKTGSPIVYGLTMPKNAPSPDLAVAFLEFLLGPEGQSILDSQGQPPIVPPLVNDVSLLPASLQTFFDGK